MSERCMYCGTEIDYAEAICNEGICMECLVYGPDIPEDFYLEEIEENEEIAV